MRDPERIRRVLDQLEVVWRTAPDLRLCQIFVCVAGKEAFYMEDEKFEEQLQQFLDKLMVSIQE